VPLLLLMKQNYARIDIDTMEIDVAPPSQ